MTVSVVIETLPFAKDPSPVNVPLTPLTFPENVPLAPLTLPVNVPLAPLTLPVNVPLPPTTKAPPTWRFSLIPAPPVTINDPEVVLVDGVFPLTSRLLPIFKFFATPIPPVTKSAPDVVLVESVSFVILTLFDDLISPLNVTGPSNCDRTWFDLPPSTTNLSFIVTSSNTALNLAGSSPVTVGTGISKLVSSPVADDFFWLPMKKSPLLFIPV